jgi:long-chain acyl-CoA synthetase
MNFDVAKGFLAVDLSINPAKVYHGENFNRLVKNCAGAIIDLGLSCGEGIGILGENSVAYMISVFGIYKSQQVCVPLNYKLSTDKIHYCIKDSLIKFIFCDKKFRHLVPLGIPVIEYGTEFDNFTSKNYDNEIKLDPNRICMTLFTSGSTGIPKKVNFTLGDRFFLTQSKQNFDHSNIKKVEQLRVLNANPFFHNAGIGWFTASIFKKHNLFLLAKFDSKIFLHTIARYKIQSIAMVTPMMSMIFNESELLQKLDLTSVISVTLVGSHANVSLINKIKKVFPNLINISNPYGLTETGAAVLGSHPDNVPIPQGSAGYPASWAELKLVDGVLHVKSKNLISKFDTSDTEWFNTHDRFRVDENGFYFFLSRSDDMLKCGGEKVYPVEIELVLDQHPNIDSSLAFGLPDLIKGEKPYAFVKLSTPCDEKELIEYAATKLASYQIPKRIWIIDSWPLNSVGKIDKKVLLSRANSFISNIYDI